MPRWARASRTEFTDLSPQLVRAAARRLAGRLPNARFRVLDIEHDAAAPGFATAAADIVIAANVIHATRRVDRTLEHVKRLLRPNGLLVLSETTAFSAFSALTFGLTDGWWLFEDGDVRVPHTPFVSAAGWRRALQEQGFQNIGAIAAGPGATTDSVHVIVLCESDGVVSDRSATAAGPGVATDAASPDAAAVRSLMVATVAAILEIDGAEIDPRAAFADLGVDPLALARIAARLSEALGRSVTNADLLAAGSLGAAADAIAGGRPATAAAAAHLPAPALQAPADEPMPGPGGGPAQADDLVEQIRGLVAETVEADVRDVDPRLPFGDFGIDSIAAVEIASRISATLGVELRATDLFNYATISRLAEHVRRERATLGSPESVPSAIVAPTLDHSPRLGDAFDLLESLPAPVHCSEAPLPAAEPAARTGDDAVAVIGMAGRFPDADDLTGVLAQHRGRP